MDVGVTTKHRQTPPNTETRVALQPMQTIVFEMSSGDDATNLRWPAQLVSDHRFIGSTGVAFVKACKRNFARCREQVGWHRTQAEVHTQGSGEAR